VIFHNIKIGAFYEYIMLTHCKEMFTSKKA